MKQLQPQQLSDSVETCSFKVKTLSHHRLPHCCLHIFTLLLQTLHFKGVSKRPMLNATSVNFLHKMKKKKAFVSVHLLANYREGHAHKGTRQVLSVHLIGYSFQVILLPRVLLNLQQRCNKIQKDCTITKRTEHKKQNSASLIYFFYKFITTNSPDAAHGPHLG